MTDDQTRHRRTWRQQRQAARRGRRLIGPLMPTPRPTRAQRRWTRWLELKVRLGGAAWQPTPQRARYRRMPPDQVAAALVTLGAR